ncbi:hypothetical protein L6164_011148 [Bauhinia variegata]|uniref:Uncharacterized protein n=1 Tax=Bauhinia variegata TaxID=167791 RepID=A0ACB9P757_BAUVA|nr:hypothetical protein L6164_011148 [Bauhinia variegata]
MENNNIFQSYMLKNNTSTPPHPSPQAQGALPADPTFQSALAAALTSIIGTVSNGIGGMSQSVNLEHGGVGENLGQKMKWGEKFPTSTSTSKLNFSYQAFYSHHTFSNFGVYLGIRFQVVTMSTPARKRLMRDFKRLQLDPPAGISGAPQDNNIMLWNAVIFGPDDTPWDGGTFKLTLQITEDYPNKPPNVRFVSRMFHPNIYADGSICLDILQNQWSPIYDVAAILTSIQSLLCDPNPNSPANSEAARLFSENKRDYNRRVREIVEQSWTAD